MIYLASPYTHKDPAVMLYRFEATFCFTSTMLQMGHTVFSPIVYGRQFEALIGHDFRSWQSFNDIMLGRATQMWVLQLPGWEESRGVAHELEYARQLGLDISFKTFMRMPG